MKTALTALSLCFLLLLCMWRRGPLDIFQPSWCHICSWACSLWDLFRAFRTFRDICNFSTNVYFVPLVLAVEDFKYGQRVFFHRCDLRILELVFGRLWYREVCHVVDHNFLSVFSKREICKLNRCSIRFALGKQLPFVFWVNESFLRFLCWGLQCKSRLIHSVLLVCLLGRKVMDVTYYATGSWSF